MCIKNESIHRVSEQNEKAILMEEQNEDDFMSNYTHTNITVKEIREALKIGDLTKLIQQQYTDPTRWWLYANLGGRITLQAKVSKFGTRPCNSPKRTHRDTVLLTDVFRVEHDCYTKYSVPSHLSQPCHIEVYNEDSYCIDHMWITKVQSIDSVKIDDVIHITGKVCLYENKSGKISVCIKPKYKFIKASHEKK